MNNGMNCLTMCRSRYKSDEEWWRAVKDITEALLKAGNNVSIRYEEPSIGIIVIEFADDDLSLGGPRPVWLTPEQEELLYDAAREEE